MCPCGNDIARRVEDPEFDFGQNRFLFASFLFFFFFSFSFLFSYCMRSLICFVPIYSLKFLD